MKQETGKPFGWFVVKAVRLSGWVLLVLMIVFTVTGYGLTGKYGCTELIGKRVSEVLHYELDEVLLAVLAVHVGAALWIAMRRWGWIGRKKT
jgi:cytochrome b subunit of formate dehydrogenase